MSKLLRPATGKAKSPAARFWMRPYARTMWGSICCASIVYSLLLRIPIVSLIPTLTTLHDRIFCRVCCYLRSVVCASDAAHFILGLTMIE